MEDNKKLPSNCYRNKFTGEIYFITGYVDASENECFVVFVHSSDHTYANTLIKSLSLFKQEFEELPNALP